jgi:hypothetical protein
MLRAKLEHRAAVRRDPGRTALSAGNFLNLLCLQKSLTAAAARRR